MSPRQETAVAGALSDAQPLADTEAPLPPAERPSAVSATAIVYATSLGVAVLSLLNVLVVSRALGPAGRGGVAFLTAVAWITSSLASGGVEEANANFAAAEPERRRALATNSVILALALGVAAMAAVALLIWLIPRAGGGSSTALRWMTLGTLPVLILGLYLRWLVRADYAFGVTNVALIITPVANVAVNGALAVLGVLTVGTAVATWLAGQAMATAVLAWYVQRRLAGFGKPDFALMRRTLAFGLKTQAGRVMLLGNFRLDQWLLGAISGPRALGLYSVAVSWAEALWYLPTALKFVQRPYLVRSARLDAGRQAAVGFRAAAIGSIVLGAVMIAAAPVLCATVFGTRFHGSVIQLRVLVPGAIGVLALTVLGNALVAQRRPVLSSVALGTGFICTLALDALLIPGHQGIGAAIASTVAYSAAGAMMCFFFTRALGCPLRELIPRASDFSWVLEQARRANGRAPAREPQPEAAGDR